MPNPPTAPSQLLHDIFAAVARRFPERIAIDAPPTSDRPTRVQMTYAGLQRQAEDIGRMLRSRATPDAIVAVLLPRDSPALYAAQLGILQAGAAFLCLDATFPDEHLRAVLTDAAAVALITDARGGERVARLGDCVPPIFDPAGVSGEALPVSAVRPDNLAYVIYTSGTTGAPKGVLIEHRAIANLVTADAAYFGLPPDARAAQCSSPIYDSSLEETWLAFAAGATLVLLDDHAIRLGPDLPAWLRSERVTVFCPPPTLLRSMGCADPARELPDIELLYVGGEALTQDLADLWAAGRRMENGYGPTECAVTALRARITPGRAVTIGSPVAGCGGLVLDTSLEAVPYGESGELCISGACLARGYRNREELTREKFVVHPAFGRVYRTGDLARRLPNGEFEYLGRIDGQVKLRGYRIELSAVEARLTECPGVVAAACTVQGEGARATLAAHLVADRGGDVPSIEAIRATLRQSLPEYMVPSRFGFLPRLPTTVGGKLDRKSLPRIDSVAAAADREIVLPRDAREEAVFNAFRRALNIPGEFSVHDDFFLELGGDSLSVVAVVLELRASAEVSVRDLYDARTIASLAERLADRGASAPPVAAATERRRGNPLVSTAIQCAWIIVWGAVGAAAASIAVFDLLPAALRDFTPPAAAIAATALGAIALMVYVPLSIALTLVLKWLLVGEYRAARIPAWSGAFTRHWIVAWAARLIPWWLFEGTELTSMTLRTLGATVGKRVHIHRGVDLWRGGWDLLFLGDNATLARDAAICTVDLSDGEIIVGAIRVGAGATVDVHAGMSPGTSLGRDGYLTTLSWLQPGEHVADGERWDGVPAGYAGEAPPAPAVTRGLEMSPAAHAAWIVTGRGAAWIAAFGVPLIVVSYFWTGLVQWLQAPIVTATGVALIGAGAALALAAFLALQAVAMRLSGPVADGVVSHWSRDGVRIWLKTGTLESAGNWLAGTIFWTWWLRLAGMRVGRDCEISTIIDVLPETVSIGEKSFFADGIYLAPPWRHRGTVTIQPTMLGERTFLGNHSVIDGGHDWPDGLFAGVATAPDARHSHPDAAWFGHPPIELPRREVVAADPRLTLRPGLARYVTRIFWEVSRFALPTLPVAIACAWYAIMSSVADRYSPTETALLFAPLLTVAAAATACGAVVILKWILLGRTKPGQRAFWSCWCGRWDFLYMAWEKWAMLPLTALDGTLLLNAFLRLTGVRLGRRVLLGPGNLQVVDPDMIFVADDATVAGHFQAHSFEDRVLKMDHIHIGRGATVGENAIVFYGSTLGAGSTISPHGVVMKRDVLDANTVHAGCPAQPVQRA